MPDEFETICPKSGISIHILWKLLQTYQILICPVSCPLYRLWII